MANRRMITSCIWRDKWFGELTFFEQALWVGLFSSCADDQGRLEDNEILIRSDVFPYKDVPIEDIEAAMQKFADGGKIICYQSGNDELVQIVNWWEHQRPQWAQHSRWPPPEGWIDRIRTRMNGRYLTENWKGKDDIQVNPSGEDQVDVQLNGQAEVRAGRQYPDPVPDPVSPTVVPEKPAGPPKKLQGPKPAKPKTEMMDAFLEFTNLGMPRRKPDVAFWWSGIGELYEIANKDPTMGVRLIEETVHRMREDELTIVGPNSLVNVARALMAEGVIDLSPPIDMSKYKDPDLTLFAG